MGRVRVGTCSFADEALTKWWYPKGLPPRERLGFYAQHFSTVEMNNTHYKMPTVAGVEAWASPP